MVQYNTKNNTDAVSASLQAKWSATAPVARQIHRRAPIIMIASFFLGVIGAISHHVFYSMLNGRAVQTSFQQQIVTSAGTAFAFVIKVSLAIGTATAYTQYLWLTMRTETVEIRKMDWMFGILGNPLAFVNVRFWLGRPLLALIAVTTWVIPLSAIFSPATLSVQPALFLTSEMITVPQRGYENGSGYTFSGLAFVGNGSCLYRGSTSVVDRFSGLAVWGGDILSVSSAAKNMTYNLSFHGPAVECIEADTATSSFVQRAIEDYTNSTGDTLWWAGWIPDQTFGPSINASFFENLQVNTASETVLDVTSKDAARIYQTMYFADHPNISLSSNPNDSFASPFVTQRLMTCSLYNASYDVAFDLLSDGVQTITAERRLLNGVPAAQQQSGCGSETDIDPTAEPMGNSTVLEAYIGNTTVIEQFNYQALFQTLGVQSRGMVSLPNGSSFIGELSMNPILGPVITGQSDVYMTFEQYASNIESMFQNFTLSLRFGLPSGNFNGQAFSSNATTNATSQTYRNAYSYAPRGLAIAYGSAILLALICVLAGLAAMYSNRVAYSDNFSTILRVTRDKAFDKLIEDEEDCDGADPLPDHIAKATIGFVERRNQLPLSKAGLPGIKLAHHA